MKKSKILSIVMSLFITLGFAVCPNKSSAAYLHSDARAMLQLVNAFRTGNEAWAYDENGKKVYYSSLGTLKYDYELEEVAKVRATELVQNFSHTRPNGTMCYTAYPGNFVNEAKGENIVAGTDLDYKEAFKIWKETYENYENQGHRRNMLSDGFDRVGIAGYHYNGCYYWVQEFASGTPTVTQPISNTPDESYVQQTEAQSDKTTDTSEVAKSVLSTGTVISTASSVATLSSVTSNNKLANTMTVSPGKKTYTAKSLKKKNKTFKINVKNAQGSVSYKSNSKKIVIKNGKVTIKKGIKAETYYITITAKGNSAYSVGISQIKIVIK